MSQYRDQIPSGLPPTVRYFDYVPFSRLLSQAAALVHHGGIGSCAQAMRAGVPQLIMPMAHDQFDNAARIEALGLGYSVCKKKYRESVVAATLDRLLGTSDVKTRCREIAGKFRTGDSLGDISGMIETA